MFSVTFLVFLGISQEWAEIRLIVLFHSAAFYTEPRLTISMHSSVIEVQYETEGFPAPEVMWKREDGKNLSDHIMTSIKLNNVTGLYHVTSNYMAPAPSLNFSFILENQLLHQYLRSIVSYKGKDFTSPNRCHS